MIDIRLLLQRMNERIEALYDRDHCIGHAYFTGLAPEDVAAAVRGPGRHVPPPHRPAAGEYFFEDWRKIRLVLADNQKGDPAIQFIRESAVDHEQDLSTLGSAMTTGSTATPPSGGTACRNRRRSRWHTWRSTRRPPEGRGGCMAGITIYEFEALVAMAPGAPDAGGCTRCRPASSPGWNRRRCVLPRRANRPGFVSRSAAAAGPFRSPALSA